MKKLLIILAIAMLTACATKDINDVKEGMSSKEVTEIAGEPSEKVSMPLEIEWWIYEEEEVLLIFENDTVSKVTSQRELEESIKGVEKGMKDLEGEINKLTE
ncbi:hypothetical protein [Marinilabilia sp.]